MRRKSYQRRIPNQNQEMQMLVHSTTVPLLRTVKMFGMEEVRVLAGKGIGLEVKESNLQRSQLLKMSNMLPHTLNRNRRK